MNKSLRVIAGTLRGRPLLAPKGETTRPTADRVREALFSMLASRVGSFEGLAVTDLFAGSGALGIEALSRGAGSCLFVEHDRAALDALRANLATLYGDTSRREVSPVAKYGKYGDTSRGEVSPAGRGVEFEDISRREVSSPSPTSPIIDVRATSVLALGPAPAPLDIILMDPPYGTGAGAVALDRLARLGWTGPATWISIETARDEPVAVPGFTSDAERIHGKARLTLLRQSGPPG